MSSTGQTTYARAALEYDKAHEAVLLEAITRAIFESSTVSDANAIVLRTAETAEALLTALAGVLAMSPAATCSPSALRKTCDDFGKRLRRKVGAAETSTDLRAQTRRATQLRRTRRKVDRVNQALAAMRAGRSLHLHHHGGRLLWSLSGGSVTADVPAAIVIRQALVVPADTALFSDLPGQEWRYQQ